ncbi:MAG: hypothetical protein COT90_05420 [Candidatus Diapherotrites archaeon CG10_big_fil_rev_8_21_14_0_10_31_34]|nr:MAG: hypothetical protein COT90_05420 [Candidatus Diapherotrites archaeon CG10_big_fil_rev_8_21_14_0_10_31_34]
MKLIYVLILLVFYFYFHFKGPVIAEWVIGILILLMVLAKLFSGILGIGKAGAKEFTRDMETDMMNAKGKGPSKEFLTEVVRETGRKSGEFLGAPESYVYKQKDLIGNLSQGAKNFFAGITALFGGKYEKPSHKEEPKHNNPPKKHVEEHHAEKASDSHSHEGHGHGHH